MRKDTRHRRIVIAAAVAVTVAGGTSCSSTAPSPDAQAMEASTTSTAAGTQSTAAEAGGMTPTSMTAAPTLTEPGLGRAAFDDTDAAMAARVSQAGIGGKLIVVRDDEVLIDESYGGVGDDTPLSVASTAKWVTASTVLTLVDDGLLTLDDPISTWLPDLEGPVREATLRQLLSHTSGVKQQQCIFDPSDELASCTQRLLAAPLEFEPGSAFSYGNASYHVAAYLAEVVTGTDFQTLFRTRIAEPMGMTGTTWGYGETRNPTPASSMITTVHDTKAFLEMQLARGTYDGRRILSEEAVAEIERNQVAGYDTSGDFAVNITGIPTYGLGTWRDVPDGDEGIAIMSGNGAGGFYPWIDRTQNAYGIVAVEDRRGAEIAVPASQDVAELAMEATGRA